MPAHRLFFALWPDAALVDDMVPRAARLGLAGRLVPRDRLHLTLAFHGMLEADAQHALMARAGAIAVDCPRFTLVIDRIGGFAGSRTAWFGIGQPPSALTTLAGALTAPRVDPAAFVPHITVVRDTSPVRSTGMFPPLIWHVDAFALVGSGQNGQPGPYRTLARWRLGARGRAI